MVRGVPKLPPRDYYLLWKEGKAPDVVIEITSKTTRREDRTKKWPLYRDFLKVGEYFQFDPREDYLKPSLQGHRWVDGEFKPIEPVAGRIPSLALGLHLERRGTELRLYDPATGCCLPTLLEATKQAKAETELLRRQTEELNRQTEELNRQTEELNRQTEELRRQTEELRRRVRRSLTSTSQGPGPVNTRAVRPGPRRAAPQAAGQPGGSFARRTRP